MHSDATQFALEAPPTLDAVLHLLTNEPGKYTPIAGGTEIMVALGAGRLRERSFLSLQHVRELRFIRFEPDAVHIGAGTTFTDIRRSTEIATTWPLLAQSASWTGSVANQNRGTLGGNLCNASPAADSPPALLAYEATVTLISTRGSRTLPYADFHLGYKKTVLLPDELLHSVSVPRPNAAARHWIRKVGTRKAQAISKVALACVASIDGTVIEHIRIGAASLADRPTRCKAAENALQGASITATEIDRTAHSARAAIASEARPIDDIRSTAKYRAAVAENLLEEFLRSLQV